MRSWDLQVRTGSQLNQSEWWCNDRVKKSQATICLGSRWMGSTVSEDLKLRVEGSLSFLVDRIVDSWRKETGSNIVLRRRQVEMGSVQKGLIRRARRRSRVMISVLLLLPFLINQESTISPTTILSSSYMDKRSGQGRHPPVTICTGRTNLLSFLTIRTSTQKRTSWSDRSYTRR